MSSYYRINIQINNFDELKIESIKLAAREWNFDEWDLFQDVLYSEIECNISGNPEIRTDAIAKDIFIANEKSCNIVIITTYLEDLPTKTYEYNHLNYEEIIK
jgi:hypothetical protein